MGATFKNAGYFRADINEKLTFLSFNSLFYTTLLDEQDNLGNEAEEQWIWLEKQLKESNDERKFILVDHIYAGARIAHKIDLNEQQKWTSKYNDKFFDLFLKYRNKIVIELAG